MTVYCVFLQFIASNYRCFGCPIIYKDIFSQRIDTVEYWIVSNETNTDVRMYV